MLILIDTQTKTFEPVLNSSEFNFILVSLNCFLFFVFCFFLVSVVSYHIKSLYHAHNFNSMDNTKYLMLQIYIHIVISTIALKCLVE